MCGVGFIVQEVRGIRAELISEDRPELVERVWLHQRNCAALHCVIQYRRHACGQDDRNLGETLPHDALSTLQPPTLRVSAP
jgi:hypothetical protein